MDFKEAQKYSTPETAKLLDYVQNIVTKTNPNDSTLKKLKIEIGEETINGNDAIVKYKKDDSNKQYVINLRRLNGNWLVSTCMNELEVDSDLQAGEMETPADSVAAK